MRRPLWKLLGPILVMALCSPPAAQAIILPNHPPAISDIADQSILPNSSTGPIPFTASDADGDTLSFQATSSNSRLIPASGIVITSLRTGRFVNVTAAQGQFGRSTITILVSDGQGGSASDSFVVTVNTPPSITDIPNQTIVESGSTGPISFQVNDVETPSALRLFSSSSNPNVLLDSGIVLNLNGTAATVEATPVQGVTGSATVTVGVSDGLSQATDTFLLTVTSANSSPSISDIPDQTGFEDLDLGPIPFVVGDHETAPESLLVSATSSDPNLFPAASLVLAGTGANRTLTIIPTPDLSGLASITVSVSDGQLVSSDTFVVEIKPVSDPPFISVIANQQISEDSATGLIPFSVADIDTPESQLVVTAASDNPALVPASGIVLGTGGVAAFFRTIQVTPAPNQFGTTTITVSASDGVMITSRSFILEVVGRNDSPGISGVQDQVVDEDHTAGPLPITLSDLETPAALLVLTGQAENESLLPPSGFQFGGSGANRLLSLTPAPDQAGQTVVTLSVSDGELTATTRFVLTVLPVNDAPTISDIPNQFTPANSTLGPVAFTVGDAETAAAQLAVGVASSNPALVPNTNLQLGGSGANRSLLITPVSGQAGTSLITVTVSDGTATVVDSFLLTVSSANNGPSISDVPDQSINEDTVLEGIAITVSDPDTPVGQLTVTAKSSLVSLVSDDAIEIETDPSNSAKRILSLTPFPNQSGAATITLTVSDGANSSADTFLLTVVPVNDAPALTDVPDQTIFEGSSTPDLPVVLTDIDTPATQLSLTGSSDNPTLVPAANIKIGGSGVNRTVRITGASGQSGVVKIVLVVSDGKLSNTESFLVTVKEVSHGPTISAIPDQLLAVNSSSAPIPFSISDVDTPIASLALAVTCDDTSLVASSGLVLAGNGSQRTLTITPASGATGRATVSVTVSDGTDAAVSKFTIQVVAGAPKIEVPPQSQSVTIGDRVVFSVKASGTPPLKYAWLFNGAPVSGAESDTLVISSADRERVGTYAVKVSNQVGAVTSEEAKLQVNEWDFGDAPESYQTTLKNNGARHRVSSKVFLGSRVDAEADGQPSGDASADDSTGVASSATGLAADDEDGVQFLTPLIPGKSADVQVVASTEGVLDAWVDFDGDGTWKGPGERVFQHKTIGAGANVLTFKVPETVKNVESFARFRFSLKGVENFDGPADDGEVEDYFLLLAQDFLDFGDAPDGNEKSGGYPTRMANNGARHRIVQGFMLGKLIDGEADGQASADARGDDGPAGTANDEDGVRFLTKLTPGEPAQVEVTAATRGVLDAWVDFNRNTSWADNGERIFFKKQLVSGANSLTFLVPSTARPGITYARFRLSRDGLDSFAGFGGEGEVEDYYLSIESPALDLGDAPEPYPTLVSQNGARHVIDPKFVLGRLIDGEPDGQPSLDALGDDKTGASATGAATGAVLDDEDGVTFKTPLVPGQAAEVEVVATDRGVLEAWVDFNRNGSWADEGEYVIQHRSLGANVPEVISFSVPTGAKTGNTYARFRLSRKGLESFRGTAPDGEVEDYLVTISGEALDYGDAPDPTYPTLLSSDGARHRRVQNFFLGSHVDVEPDGQPDANALGDDANGQTPGDEDGVRFLTPLVAGQAATVEVTAGISGTLDAWVDFNKNGSWADRQDRIFNNRAIGGGVNVLTFSVPSSSRPGETFARFRFSRGGVKEFYGPANEGEVEDYKVRIEPRQPCEMGCQGTNYWLTFPGNYAPDTNNPVVLTVQAVGSAGTVVNVFAPGLNPPYSASAVIGASGFVSFAVPKAADLGDLSGVIGKKGVQVVSSEPIAVYGLNRVRYTTDGFFGIPVEALGRDYLVQSYRNMHSGAPDLNGTQFAVVATEADTTVTITPTVGVGLHPAGIPFSVILQQGQTYQLRSSRNAPADLSGSSVIANKPIAVFGSHRCANIQSSDVFFCDYLVEQLLPTTSWGFQFFTYPLATRFDDTLRIMAAQDATVIAINGVPTAVLNRGQIHESLQPAGVAILSTKPVLVMQYANSSDYDSIEDADPFMATVPQRGLYSRVHQFVTAPRPPLIPISDIGKYFKEHYVNIIAPTVAVGSVQLDGAPVAGFTPIAGGLYSGVSVKVSAGAHTVTAAQPVGVMVYGWAKFDSYGYPSCINFGDTTPPIVNCPPPFTNFVSSAAGTLAANTPCRTPVPDLRSKVTYFDGCGFDQPTLSDVQNPTVVQLPVPGTLVGPGVHTIVLSVADARGNIGYCTTTMTVIDPNLPTQATLHCPDRIQVQCTSSNGAVVQYNAYAVAGCEVIPLKCKPESGSLFPVGSTVVNCELDDPRFLPDSCAFTVEVTCQTGGKPSISINHNSLAGTLTISAATGAVLQMADSITGPWTDVANVEFPFTIDARKDTQHFYRVKLNP